MFKFQTKYYVSDIDKMLAEFATKHAKTETEQFEIDKYQRIFALRDHATTTT